jgi:citronellol/citronellal dehydrogenase
MIAPTMRGREEQEGSPVGQEGRPAGREGSPVGLSESKIFARELLRGKVALVTGGGTGLGRASAIELARCGAAVVVVGRREEPLRETVAEIERLEAARSEVESPEERLGDAGERDVGERDAGEQVYEPVDRAGQGQARGAHWAVGDVRERAQARALVQSARERWGRLDVLVNNAGGQYFTPAEGIAAKGWGAVWRLNVDGMLNMAEEAVAQETEAGEAGRQPRRTTAGGGLRVINVTLSPHHGMPGMAHSGAARAAVEALTRELASRWAQVGATVCAVAAGHFDTEAMAKYPDVVRAGMARSVPLQRLGTVHEHAWLVALLASPLGAALNGSTVTLDGARDNWFGPWPPPGLTDAGGEVPTEQRRRRGEAVGG